MRTPKIAGFISKELLTDSDISVKQMQEFVEKNGGVVSHLMDSYNGKNRSKSVAIDAIELFEKQQMRPLLSNAKKMIKAHGGEIKDFEFYMIAKHIPERNKTMNAKKKTEGEDYAGETEFKLATGKTAEEYVKDYESKVNNEALVKETWYTINAATNASLDYLEENGVISSKDKKDLKKGWKYYVPLRGWDEDMNEAEADMSTILEQSFGSRFSDPLKKAKGRESLSDSPLGYIQQMMATAVNTGTANRYYQRAYNLVAANQSRFEGIFKIEKAHKNETLYTNNRRPSPNVLYVNVDGVTHKIWFKDSRVPTALTGNNMIIIKGKLIEGINGFTRFMTQNMTSRNPEFAIRNLLRDQFFALCGITIDENGKFLGVFLESDLMLFKNILWNDVMGRDLGDSEVANLYREWKAGGGRTGYTAMKSIKQLQTKIRKQLRGVNLYDYANPINENFLAWKVGKGLSDAFEAVSTVSENLTRFSYFMADLKTNGKKENGNYTNESLFNAITKSKNATTNFDRKGTFTLFNSIYGFFNANIQGAVRLFDVIKTAGKSPKARRRIIETLGGFMAMGYLEALLNDGGGDDDEYYNSLSDYDRATNLIVGDLRIPLPHGFRMFKNLGVQVYRVQKGDVSIQRGLYNALEFGMGEIVPQQVNPFNYIQHKSSNDTDIKGTVHPFIPTAMLPFYEVYTNSDFMGRRIHPVPFTDDLKENTAKTELHYANVNAGLKMFTDYIAGLGGYNPARGNNFTDNANRLSPAYDWSPESVEHLISGMFAGAGRFAISVLKISKSFVAQDLSNITTNDIPFVRAMWKPKEADKIMLQKFYDNQAYMKGLINFYQRLPQYVNKVKKGRVSISDDIENRLGVALQDFNAVKPMITDIGTYIKLSDDVLKEFKSITKRSGIDTKDSQYGIMRDLNDIVYRIQRHMGNDKIRWSTKNKLNRLSAEESK
jgi:hypothetical protein